MNSLDTMEQALEYLENLVSGIEQAFKVQKSEPNAVINENQLIEEIKDIKNGQNMINGNIIKLYDTYDEMKRRMYPSSEGKPDKEEEIENRLEKMENDISGIYQRLHEISTVLDRFPSEIVESLQKKISQQREEKKEAGDKPGCPTVTQENSKNAMHVFQSAEEANENANKAFGNYGVKSKENTPPPVSFDKSSGNQPNKKW